MVRASSSPPHGVAHVVGEQSEAFDAEAGEDPGHHVGLEFDRVPLVGLGRQAEAEQVHHHHPSVATQLVDHVGEVERGRGESVDDHQRLGRRLVAGNVDHEHPMGGRSGVHLDHGAAARPSLQFGVGPFGHRFFLPAARLGAVASTGVGPSRAVRAPDHVRWTRLVERERS
jgi:hypothetical protein